MNLRSSSNPELQRALDRLHPFHFALDEDLRIAHAGRLLRRVFGEQIIGRSLLEVFVVIEPKEFPSQTSWDEHEDVLLKGVTSEVTLRGQCMTLAGLRYFVGAPWFTLDAAHDAKLSPAMALAHERWGDHLLALQLFGQQRRDLEEFRGVLMRRSQERDALHESLIEEKTRLQTVLAAATDAIITTDSQGNVVSVNPAATRLFGYPADEIVGKNVKILMPDVMARQHDGFMRRYLDTGTRHVIGIGREVTARRKDGTYFPCELSLGEMKLGDAIFFTGILRDITKRKRAEELLRQSEHFVTTVLEHLPDMVFVKDAIHLRFVRLNKAAEDLLGYNRQELLGKSDYDFFPTTNADFFTAKDRQVLASGQLLDIPEEPIQTRQRGLRFLHTRKIPIAGPDGAPQYLLGLSQDITERKVAEERQAEMLVALQKSHDDLRRILNQLRLGVLAVDSNGRISFASNSAFTEGMKSLGVRWDQVLQLNDGMRNDVRAELGKPENERRRLEMAFGQGADRRRVELEIRDDPRDLGCHIFYLYDVTDLYRLRQKITELQSGRIVGDSAAMHGLYAAIARVAQGEWTVLIEGETGTGKELVAQAIHYASARRKGPFVAANCAGLTESILGSQLFGHVKGAFTGAISDREGLFEAAIGGTLFLDEIGDVSAPVQAALLRALQEKEITRLGETRPRKVDVRIVAATNRNLPDLVKEGKFREDLLYRLRSARVRVPPLRERKEDIPLLVAAFLAEERVTAGKLVTEVGSEAMRQLARYDWPGNVRELRGAIEHAVVHCRRARIEIEDLPPEIRELAPYSRPITETHPESERERIIAVLRRTGGNRARAARILGIGRATLYRRLEDLRIVDEDVGDDTPA